MFTIGPKYLKLKSELHLAVHRLRFLQAKNSELSEKIKSEIAALLKNGRYVQAQIKCQTLIRIDSAVEAFCLVEMFCESLLHRYDLFQNSRQADEGLINPICSLIWVSPYFKKQIPELKCISEELSVKYGNKFARDAVKNVNNAVSSALIEKVRKFTATDDEIEQCLSWICVKYGIEYDPAQVKKKSGEGNWCKGKSESTVYETGREFEAEGAINSSISFISTKKAFSGIMSKLRHKKDSKPNEGRISEKSVEDNKKTESIPDLEDFKMAHKCDKVCSRLLIEKGTEIPNIYPRNDKIVHENENGVYETSDKSFKEFRDEVEEYIISKLRNIDSSRLPAEKNMDTSNDVQYHMNEQRISCKRNAADSSSHLKDITTYDDRHDVCEQMSWTNNLAKQKKDCSENDNVNKSSKIVRNNDEVPNDIASSSLIIPQPFNTDQQIKDEMIEKFEEPPPSYVELFGAERDTEDDEFDGYQMPTCPSEDPDKNHKSSC